MARILDSTTADYLETVRPEVDDLLLEMEAHAREERVPIAAREVAQLQAQLARSTGAERVLEIGTAIGYSTIQVARAGPAVVTLERDPERIAAAEEYLRRAGVDDRVTIREGDALETLAELEGPFDLVFIDALKTEYSAYLDAVVPLLADAGVVVADNLLWDGEVPAATVGDAEADEATVALAAFNEAFVDHDDLDAIVTPLGDGTGIGVKR